MTGRIQIGGRVVEAADPSQPALETPLGREVQQFARTGEQPWVPFEVKPQRAVPLVRSAPPADRVGTVPVIPEARVASCPGPPGGQ